MISVEEAERITPSQMNCYERDDEYFPVLKEPYNIKHDDSPLTVAKLIEILSEMPSEAKIMRDEDIALYEVWTVDLRKPVDKSVKNDEDDEPIVVIG